MKLGPHSIDVLRAPLVAGDYGNATTREWADASTSTITGCSVQPAPSSEYAIDRDSITTRLLAFVPAHADIEATDRVVWSGETYDIDGDVLRWEFGLSYFVINLRRSAES